VHHSVPSVTARTWPPVRACVRACVDVVIELWTKSRRRDSKLSRRVTQWQLVFVCCFMHHTLSVSGPVRRNPVSGCQNPVKVTLLYVNAVGLNMTFNRRSKHHLASEEVFLQLMCEKRYGLHVARYPKETCNF